MSAIITCFAPFQGLATALDTLCSQAYGSGQKQLVGLYCQRMMLILLVLAVPIAVLWSFSERMFLQLLPDERTATLCSIYLRILTFGIPGFAAFEAGRRYLQAQGLFKATTYIVLIGAPLHATLLWLFVWKLEFGFVGAPISVAITRTSLPIFLVIYIRLFGGNDCWDGFSRRAFLNIGAMLRLAIPGMIMVEAEMLCFEIMTIVSSRFGVDYLAAQSIFATLATLSSQIPLSLAVAASTRVAILIGAGRVNDAKLAAKVVSDGTPFQNVVVLKHPKTGRFYVEHILTAESSCLRSISLRDTAYIHHGQWRGGASHFHSAAAWTCDFPRRLRYCGQWALAWNWQTGNWWSNEHILLLRHRTTYLSWSCLWITMESRRSVDRVCCGVDLVS